MTDHAVVIAGGGPTGLMLAGELALAGIDVAIVERRENQELEGLRAGGLHIRTIEVLDQRGIADRFLAKGQIFRRAPFAGGTLDICDLPTRHSYYLSLWQTQIEQILAEWVSELKVPTYRAREVTGLAQQDGWVDVELSDGRCLRAQYLAGCDGGRSLIRKQAGIAFLGWDPSKSYLIAEIETAEEPEWGIRRGVHGVNAFAKLDDGQRARVVVCEERIRQDRTPSLDELREALIAAYGTDYGLRCATSISRFTDMARQAECYRKGRVLLAGDAAHIHSPVGGQGLNIGMQDAVNLGWKLAQVVHGTSPETLLDTYHAERHPVGERLLRNTMALTAMERGDERIGALRAMMTELLQGNEARKQYVAMMSGLDIRYDLGEGHPLLGRRMPDLEVTTANGPVGIFTLLHDGRPVLLNLGDPDSLDIRGWESRVKLIHAKYDGAWELPIVGAITAPHAVLIRPDGHVAWVGEPMSQGLRDAFITWIGAPSAA